jgi:hypothetical protein
MVRWYDLGQLARTTIQVAISEALGTRIDPRRLHREEPNGRPFQSRTEDPPATAPETKHRNAPTEVWFDYVADVADGYEACRAIAWMLAKPSLKVKNKNGEDVTTQRGSLLVVGGDLVYPTPEPGAYQERFIQPYGEAWSAANREEGNAPIDRADCRMLAIPGNHDWYDSLVEFSEIFLSGPKLIGGWLVGQQRSYFARKIANKLWIWAVDVQLEGRLDGPQLHYFETMAETMEEGSRIILIGAEPEWLQLAKAASREESGDQYGLHGVLRDLLRAKGNKGRFVLHLAGDLHHYRRHEEADRNDNPPMEGARHWVVCGGGGAFTYPTHNVPGDGEIPWGTDRILKPKACFPSVAESKTLSKWIALRFPLRNWGFSTGIGVVYTAIAWGIPKLKRGVGDLTGHGAQLATKILPSAWEEFRNGPSAFLADIGTTSYLLALAIPAVGYVVSRRLDPKNWWLPWFGVLHGLTHSFSAVALYFLVMEVFGRVHVAGIGDILSTSLRDGLLGGLARALCYFGAASMLGGALFGLYLKLSHSLGKVHANELYSAIGSPHFKSFLRFHVDKDGSLEVYVLGFEKCPTEESAIFRSETSTSLPPPTPILVERFLVGATPERN